MPMTPEQIEQFLNTQRADSAQIAKSLEGFTALLTSVTSRLDSVDARFKAEDAKLQETAKAKAKARVDSFEFTPRINGETDAKYKSRHDSEERLLRLDMVEAGIEESKAAADAAKRRADAEMEMADAAKAAADAEKAAADAAAKAAADAAKAADTDDKDKDDKDYKKEGDSVQEGNVVSLADYNKLLARVDSLAKPLADAELNKVGELQKRVDSIYIANGEKMPPLVAGDTYELYKRKVLNDLKKYTSFKDAELSVLAVAGDSAFEAVGNHIIEQAAAAARTPANLKPGTLRMLTRQDGGHTYNEWAGDTSWMNQFATPRGYVKEFNVPKNSR